jgi:hypothetical protein
MLIEYLASGRAKLRPIGAALLRLLFDEIVYGLSRNNGLRKRLRGATLQRNTA